MKSKNKIFVITSSRSDYSLLKSLIFKLKKQKTITTKVIVTGSHLEKNFGYTFREILKDKIAIDKKIFLNLKKAEKKEIIFSMSIGVKKFFDLFSKDKPDGIIILGDRFEILPVAYVANILKLKIFHFAGGEKTPFVYDNSIRNCLSFLSNFHFVAHSQYKNNLIKMGIEKKLIFNIGSLGIDGVTSKEKINKKQILRKHQSKFQNYFLITFHPTTLLKKSDIIKETKNLIYALDEFKKYYKIFTLPTADYGSNDIKELIIDYCKKNHSATFLESLGSKKYLAYAKNSSLIIGNSSSGLSEVPSLKKISINVGLRQKGRISGKSVIHSLANKVEIIKNIKKGLILSKNLKFIDSIKNPYGNGDTSNKAIKIIKKVI